MTIELKDIGKVFSDQVLFKNINYTFQTNHIYGVLGSNGSGKSTFLKILSKYLAPSKGQVIASGLGEEFRVSFCAPYQKLIEELTLYEAIEMHYKLLDFSIDLHALVQTLNLPNDIDDNKFLEDYSSGMKQKVKLLFALHGPQRLVLLDEPCSNLDVEAISWYENLLKENSIGKIIIIASNDKRETTCADEFIDILDYK